jgi:hypothetical protein
MLFALLAMGFVALWARSYYRWDMVVGDDFRIASLSGVTGLGFYGQDAAGPHAPYWIASPAGDDQASGFWRSPLLRFEYRHYEVETTLYVPHWFLAASSLGLAALFAFKRTWRYSLRTILVATTLLAGLLGLAVYAV